MPASFTSPRTRARFEQRTARRGVADCWPWIGRVLQTGYGTYNGYLAHRLSYYLATGKDPAGMLVCHHCDNPSCVNPAHLFLGSNEDSVRAAASKGLLGSPEPVTLSRTSRNRLRRAFDEGATYRELQATFRVGRDYLDELLSGHRTSNKLSDADLVVVAREAAAGTPMAEIARRFGVTPRAIRYTLRKRIR